MKYIYLLDENKVCYKLTNFYDDNELANVVGDLSKDQYVVLDERVPALNHKYENGKFIQQEDKIWKWISNLDLKTQRISYN